MMSSIETRLQEAARRLGAGDTQGAVTLCRQVLSSTPHDRDASKLLGIALLRQGHAGEALEHLDRAFTQGARDAATLNAIGATLEHLGRFDEALTHYRNALEAMPHNAGILFNIGNAARRAGHPIQARHAYAAALAIEPNNAVYAGALAYQKLSIADWGDLASTMETARALARSGRGAIHPYRFLYFGGSPQEERACAERWMQAVCKDQLVRFEHSRSLRGRGHLSIAYLSADFREHAIAYLVAELVELHDRERFKVTGYSYGPATSDPMRRRLERGFDKFVDVNELGDEALARLIHNDGIDILVDLTGHTTHGRPRVLSFRPAPIQVNYLGYPGTMGSDLVDYIVADQIIIPAAEFGGYAEQVAWMAGSYQMNDRRRPISAAPSRRECGLPREGIVFCSFNREYKITPEVFAVWMRLLKRIPGSVLWLLSSSAEAITNLRREASSRGVDPDRIVFAPRQPHAEHLARYCIADLCLDTWPYGSHTTGSDSLWAGCPMVTLLGKTFASRVGASLVTAVGMPQLVARSTDEYLDIALRLASDASERVDLRRHLEMTHERLPLFDTGRSTAALERLYVAMWRRYEAGCLPGPITALHEDVASTGTVVDL